MKPKSIIEKGKRFEKFIANEIEEIGLGSARREQGSGSGKKKGDIFANIPFLIEAKNQPTAPIKRILAWIDQAQKQANIGNWAHEKWCLIFRDPRTPEDNPECYAVIDMWEFLKLLKKDSEPLIKLPDRNLRWKLERLKTDCQEVIKDI
jgi:Holliday junction resolvase